MTIIAYKNEIIAGDSKASLDDLYFFDFKKTVKSSDGTIGGACGSIYWINNFIDWILSGRKKHWTDFNERCSALFITTDRQVHCIDSSGIMPIIMVNNCISIGSGREIALGAMDAGASAEEAVKITMKRDAYCDGFISIEKLGDPPIKKSSWWRSNRLTS